MTTADTIPAPVADTLPCPGSISPEWQRARDETLAALIAVSGPESRRQLSIDLDRVLPDAISTYAFLLERGARISTRERHYCLATSLFVDLSLEYPKANELISDVEPIIDQYLGSLN